MKTLNETYCDEEMNEWFICPICRKQIIHSKHLHHIFGGAYKTASEKFNYLVYLHPECHRKLHDYPTMENDLKQKAKEDFLKNHSEEEFIKTFCKSYRKENI